MKYFLEHVEKMYESLVAWIYKALVDSELDCSNQLCISFEEISLFH